MYAVASHTSKIENGKWLQVRVFKYLPQGLEGNKVSRYVISEGRMQGKECMLFSLGAKSGWCQSPVRVMGTGQAGIPNVF